MGSAIGFMDKLRTRAGEPLLACPRPTMSCSRGWPISMRQSERLGLPMIGQASDQGSSSHEPGYKRSRA